MTPAHVSVPPSTTIGYGGPRPGDRVEAHRGRCAARPPRCRCGPGLVGGRLGGGTRLHPGTLIVRGVDRKDPLQAPPRSTSRSWGAGCFRARRPPDALTSFDRTVERSDPTPTVSLEFSNRSARRTHHPRWSALCGTRAAPSGSGRTWRVHLVVRGSDGPAALLGLVQRLSARGRSSGAGSSPYRQGARRRQGRQGAG